MQAFVDPESARDRAFERLYRRYVKDVYRYALALLRNPAEAEDVTQTTFMNAYAAFKRGDEPFKPQHWLIKIAHNAARTRYARNARRPQEVPLEESLAELPVPDDDALSVHELLDALSKLPFNQRAALVMCELEGRSYTEISETLGVSVPAVEGLIFRARRSLRRDRNALQALTLVQLPRSLAVFGGGGNAVAAGGAAAGTGILVKAVFAIVASVVVGGVGYKTVHAARAPRHAHLSALREPERPLSLVNAAPSTVAGRAHAAASHGLAALGAKIVVSGPARAGKARPKAAPAAAGAAATAADSSSAQAIGGGAIDGGDATAPLASSSATAAPARAAPHPRAPIANAPPPALPVKLPPVTPPTLPPVNVPPVVPPVPAPPVTVPTVTVPPVPVTLPPPPPIPKIP